MGKGKDIVPANKQSVDKASKAELENDQLYRKLKAKEIINRVKERIEKEDPAVVRSIKTLLSDDYKKDQKSKKK